MENVLFQLCEFAGVCLDAQSIFARAVLGLAPIALTLFFGTGLYLVDRCVPDKHKWIAILIVLVVWGATSVWLLGWPDDESWIGP